MDLSYIKNSEVTKIRVQECNTAEEVNKWLVRFASGIEKILELRPTAPGTGWAIIFLKKGKGEGEGEGELTEEKREELIKRIMEDIRSNFADYSDMIFDCVEKAVSEWEDEDLCAWLDIKDLRLDKREEK